MNPPLFSFITGQIIEIIDVNSSICFSPAVFSEDAEAEASCFSSLRQVRALSEWSILSQRAGILSLKCKNPLSPDECICFPQAELLHQKERSNRNPAGKITAAALHGCVQDFSMFWWPNRSWKLVLFTLRQANICSSPSGDDRILQCNRNFPF